jgi:hypothetical protein
VWSLLDVAVDVVEDGYLDVGKTAAGCSANSASMVSPAKHRYMLPSGPRPYRALRKRSALAWLSMVSAAEADPIRYGSWTTRCGNRPWTR